MNKFNSKQMYVFLKAKYCKNKKKGYCTMANKWSYSNRLVHWENNK